MGRKPQLLDQWGRPVQRAVLKDEIAAATVGGVRSPISGYPGDGLDPVRLAQILRSADMGDPVQYLELAETIEERDPHYLGVLGTRRRQVSQIDITVEPADDSAEALRHAEHVRSFIERDELGDELFDILDAIGKGYSFTEIIWDTSMGQWMPARLEWRDPRWFRPAQHDLTTPMMLDDNGQPQPLPAFKFIRAQIKAKSGLPVRSGLARAATWAYLFKKYTERDWAIFSQTYGQPLRIGKYDKNARDEDKDTLYKAVAQIAGDMAGIIPKSMEIEFIETGNLSATGQLYKERCEYLDKQVSKAVLGQTATTDSVTGGLGSGSEHGEVRQDIETADAKALGAVLTRDIARPMVALEFGEQQTYPRIRIARPEAEDLKAFADAISPLIDRGLPVSQQSVLDKFGLPAPKSGEKLLAPASKSAASGNPEGGEPPSFAVKGGLKGSTGAGGDLTGNDAELQSEARERAAPAPVVPAELVAELPAQAGKHVGRLLGQIEEMMKRAESLEEFREMLLSVFPDLDAGPLVETLADAMAMAEVAGRLDVTEAEVADG